MREPVELARAYVLLNHGPTVLVSSAHAGRRNVMAAAWNMPLDFTPPKLAVVIDKSTFTRELVEASGEFVINVPTVAQAAATTWVGNHSGRDGDKSAACGLRFSDAAIVAAPLVDGCVAWLECKVLPEPEMARKYDLFVAEVVAAWADPRVFHHNRWRFTDPALAPLRTIHHVAGGNYLADGAWVR
jgi:flavin reductase (DIM6/NTAB) family NADH-FMN oxidoreductase RutF